MRILFIAMSNSIHTARWVNQLNGQGWDIHLFPVENTVGVHHELRGVTVHDLAYGKPRNAHESVEVVDPFWPHLKNGWPLPRGMRQARRLARRLQPQWEDRAWRLAQTIQKLQPDIVHSLELQHAAYLTLDVRQQYTETFPTWAVSNWGSDIYLFGRLANHKERIRAVMESCDYYGCECDRDVQLGRDFGFRGEVLPVLPNTGGFDLEHIRRFRQAGPVSSRRRILLKGYQGWAGRALVGLRAIELCAEELKGYSVALYVAGDDVRLAAELLTERTGIPIELIPHVSHDEMLQLHGSARISIGLSISDAISTSLLEAMVMGSFPIQSHTSCGDKWIRCGESGLLVHPEDPSEIASAIRRALDDDALVDTAAEANWQTAIRRLDQSIIRPQVIESYQQMLAGKSVQQAAVRV